MNTDEDLDNEAKKHKCFEYEKLDTLLQIIFIYKNAWQTCYEVWGY